MLFTDKLTFKVGSVLVGIKVLIKVGSADFLHILDAVMDGDDVGLQHLEKGVPDGLHEVLVLRLHLLERQVILRHPLVLQQLKPHHHHQSLHSIA